MARPSTNPPAIRLGSGGPGNLTGEHARQTRPTIRRLLGYLQPYLPQLLVVLLFVIISTLMRLIGPILIGQAIDGPITSADGTALRNHVIWIMVVFIVAGLTTLVQSLLMITVGQKLVADVRAELFQHVQNLSMAFHDRTRTGDLMSRLSNDTEAINRTLSNGLVDFSTNILLMAGILVTMFLLSWQLALAAFIIIPIMLAITTWITVYSRRAFRQVQRHLGTMNAIMEENISGIRVVQAFAQEDKATASFKEANAAYRKVGITADIITAALGPMFTTMMTITIALTAWLGGWLALQGLVGVGVIATFIIYIMNFFRPMRSIAMLYNQLQSALAGSERIFAVLDVKPSVTDEAEAVSLENLRGEVIFEQVSFAYSEDRPVLEDISLHARAGQMIALVGPTGAGKTTIVSLLNRFYDVTKGSISIDGLDIRRLTQQSIRQQLGMVLQDTFLFSASIMENIRYGRLEASDEEVITAAKIANADRFIRLLPEGYSTRVSEQGKNFSQGQRQLLAIARAVLANPRILILDEATSSVDTRTELHIQEALLRLLKGRTAFVIAHRLSTIRQADQVLVINNQQIIERGTHQALLAQKGFYFDLYMSQYRSVHDPL